MTQPTNYVCPSCGEAYTPSQEQRTAAQQAGQQVQCLCAKCNKSFTLMMVAPINCTTSVAGPKKNNGWAIASLICGVFFCIPLVPSVLAIIFGILGLRKTRNPQVSGQGFAIAGTVLGGIGIMLFLLMAACLLSAIKCNKERANQLYCASNMRNIGQALWMYAEENGSFPPNLNVLKVRPYLSPKTFVCLSSSGTVAPKINSPSPDEFSSYIYVYNALGAKCDPSCVLLYEPLGNHGGQGTNMLFADMHVEWVNRSKADNLIANLQAGINPPRELWPQPPRGNQD